MLCRAKLKPVVKSLASLEWVSTLPSWWLIKWRCSHSLQSQGAQATTGLQMGKAAEWDGNWLCTDQAWTESCAEQDRVCVIFHDQAYWFRSCSDYPHPGQMCQGENHKDKLAPSEEVCHGQREYLPLLVLSSLAGSHLSSAPDWRA